VTMAGALAAAAPTTAAVPAGKFAKTAVVTARQDAAKIVTALKASGAITALAKAAAGAQAAAAASGSAAAAQTSGFAAAARSIFAATIAVSIRIIRIAPMRRHRHRQEDAPAGGAIRAFTARKEQAERFA
jgi:hypothetical protein